MTDLTHSSTPNDEALFNSLVRQLPEGLQPNLNELLTSDLMQSKADEFRYNIVQVAKEDSEELAIHTLQFIADQPTVEERYHKAEQEGLVSLSEQ